MLAIRDDGDVRRAPGHFSNIAARPPRTAGATGLAAVGRHDGPLLALRAHSLAGRFHGWRGASGLRYVCTIFAKAGDAGAFADAVVIAVARHACGTSEAVLIGQSGALPDCFASSRFVARARELGTNEWHVHLMAATALARTGAIADLQAASGRNGCCHA